MNEEQKSVFISYRRQDASFIARAIFQDLYSHGYDVIMDIDNISPGESFETIIRNQIAARAHFLVILTPRALQRFSEPQDMMRLEIEFALQLRRNIVPLLLNDFTFAGSERYLTGILRELRNYNSISIPVDYFDVAMERLRTRFLSQPVEVVIKPAPAQDQALVQSKIEEIVMQPRPSEYDLNAEEYSDEEFMPDSSSDQAIAYYSEAIRLNPQYTEAYVNRGNAHKVQGNVDGAIADYSEAIRINPEYVNAYLYRGDAYKKKADYEKAIADYQVYLAIGGGQQNSNQLKVQKWIRELQQRLDSQS